MHKAPWASRLLAFILVGTAISFPLQIMVLYGHGPSEITQIINKLTLFNLLTMALCMTSSYYLWNCHKASLLFLGLTGIVVAINNFFVGSISYDYSMTTTLSATGLFLCTYALMLHPDCRKILKHQNQRWWLQASRKPLNFSTQISNMAGSGFTAQTFDLSKSGAFVQFDDDTDFDGLKVGDYCNMNIQVSEYKKVKCLAKIVRFTDGNGKYPRGYGMHFENFDGKDRKQLSQLLHQSEATSIH